MKKIALLFTLFMSICFSQSAHSADLKDIRKIDSLKIIELEGFVSQGGKEKLSEVSNELIDTLLADGDYIKAAHYRKLLADFQRVKENYELKELKMKNRIANQRLCVALILLLLLVLLVLVTISRLRKNRLLYKTSLARMHNQEELEHCIVNSVKNNLSQEEKIYIAFLKLIQQDGFFRNSEIDQNKISVQIGTNRTYLYNAVKRCSGKTVSEVILEHRLNYAAERLISDRDLSVVVIGEEAGFAARSTFYRLFTKQFGISPAAYRSFSNKI